MATLMNRRLMQRRLLEAIGNKNPEELGQLALDMMKNTEAVYDEIGIIEGEEDYVDYTLPASVDNSAYERLEALYKERFSGVPSNNDIPREDIPVRQPPADDIMITVDPDSGETKTYDVGDKEIFGDDFE